MTSTHPFALVPAAACALLLAAGPAPARADGPIVGKLATVAPEGTPWAEQLQLVKQRVEKESGGKLKLKPFLGGALGDENATVEECKRGTIQIWAGSTAALAVAVPELGLLELPYLFRSEAEADYVLDVVLYEELRKKLEERGFILLFWAENGYRSFGTRFGFVRKPADLAGRKMRSQEADIHLEMYKALGAKPVPIPVTEVISSLNSGLIDGFDNTPLYAQAASWYKGITHYTVSNHIYQPAAVVASKQWWDTLGPELQKVLLGEPAKESLRVRTNVRALTPALLENFRAAGIQVELLTPQERDGLARATEPVYGAWLKGKGRSAKPLVEKARKGLADFRAGKVK